MFIFATNEFGGSSCGRDGCTCWCESGASPDGSCSMDENRSFNLYKFIKDE